MSQRVLANSDVEEITLSVPAGHRHLRAALRLRSGEELLLQEATVAALVRAYVTVKTHPVKSGIRLIGRQMEDDGKKPEFASWQLLEGD
jgi:hypothetical protein